MHLSSTATDWLVPFAVVVLTALFGYVGGWVIKRQDIERAIAAESDELLEEAQKLAGERVRWSEATLDDIKRLVGTAKMRSRRLPDDDLTDRYFAAELFLTDCALAFREGQRYWAEVAISNVRLALDSYTKPPRLLPRIGKDERQRIFPTKPEYTALLTYDDQNVPDVLKIANWQTAHGVR